MRVHITLLKTKGIFTTRDYFLPFAQIHMVPIQMSVIRVPSHSNPRIRFIVFAPNLRGKNFFLWGVSLFYLPQFNCSGSMACTLNGSRMANVNEVGMEYGFSALVTPCLISIPAPCCFLSWSQTSAWLYKGQYWPHNNSPSVADPHCCMGAPRIRTAAPHSCIHSFIHSLNRAWGREVPAIYWGVCPK